MTVRLAHRVAQRKESVQEMAVNRGKSVSPQSISITVKGTCFLQIHFWHFTGMELVALTT